MVMVKWLITALLGVSLLLGLSPNAEATELNGGAPIFEVHCAGCHVNGGNIVRRGKTLKLKALERNHVDSIEAIAQLVANGKGNMSAYRDRLSPAEIDAVSAYVWERAAQNWR